MKLSSNFLGWVTALTLISTPVLGADYRATHCEIFADRVLAYRDYITYQHRFVRFFLKTINNRLDGRIVEVGFYNVLSDASGNAHRTACAAVISDPQIKEDCDSLSIWKKTLLKRFADSDDYWSLDLRMDGPAAFPHAYEGSFYAETDRGVRYWLNSPSGGNFNIYDGFFDSLEKAQGAVITSADWTSAIPTLLNFQDFNPGQCR